MNILFLCDEYPPCQHGGIGTVTQTLVRSLAKKGNNVVVAGFYPFFRKAAERENDHGVEIYRFFYGSKWKLIFSKHSLTGRFINIKKELFQYTEKIMRLVAEYKIDIIEMPDFVEAFRYSGPKMISFPDFGAPLVLKIHGTYSFLNYYNKTRIKENALLKKERTHISSAKNIIAVSSFAKTFIEDFFKYKSPIKVIYNGLMINIINDNSLYNPLNPFNVVYAGKLSRSKGVFNLIKSWQKVHNLIPSAILFVYGTGSKKEIQQLTELIIKSNLNSSVHLEGFIKNEKLLTIYSNASCAVFPSFMENFSLAPMEAMQTGCPVIYTKLSSGPELINNGIDGILINPNNIDEIADAIILLLKEKEMAKEIGRKGMKKIRESYNIDVIADQHLEFYRKLTKN